MAPTRIAQLVTIASLPLSASAGWERGFSGYGAPFNSYAGPFEANTTEFLDAIKESNSTALFKIPGYDVSKPFPGEPMDGWTISIAALDLPIPTFTPEGSEYSYYVPDAPAMLGSSLTIQAPESLIKTNADGTNRVDTHASWGMCMWDWGHPSHLFKDRWNNQDNKPLAADGSCKGFLSDACIAALEKQASEHYTVHAPNATAKYTRYGSPVSCQSMLTPDECGEYGAGNAGGSVPSYGGVPVRYLNGSVTDANGWEYEADKGEHYNSTQDLRDYWDSMVLNYWPVLTLMVNATYDPSVYSYERPAGLARMHCIAPNGVGTGKAFTFAGTVPSSIDVGNQNEKGEDSDENSSTRLGSPGVMGVVLAAGVVLGGWMW